MAARNLTPRSVEELGDQARLVDVLEPLLAQSAEVVDTKGTRSGMGT
jgi:hypothetical protein